MTIMLLSSWALKYPGNIQFNTLLFAELILSSYAAPYCMLLLIVTLTLYFNGNEITTHLIPIKLIINLRNRFLRGNISRQNT